MLAPLPLALNWRRLGPGAGPDASGRTLMLHCALGHGGMMEPLARRLNRTALAPDLPGHGDSPPAPAVPDLQAAAVDAVLAGLPSDAPLDIIGHSFGATVALRLALSHPGRVRRLVLIEPVFFAAARNRADYPELMAWSDQFDRLFAQGAQEAAAQAFTSVWGTGQAWGTLPAPQRTALVRQIPMIPALNPPLMEDIGQILAPGRLESLSAPVLLLAGAASPPIIPAIQDALAARLPQTRRTVIDGAGHMLPLTHSGAVARAVSGFLDAA